MIFLDLGSQPLANEYLSKKISEAFKKKLPHAAGQIKDYRIIMVGDFNDFNNDFDVFTPLSEAGIKTELKLMKSPEKTCCETNIPQEKWPLYADYIVDSAYPELNFFVPWELYNKEKPYSDHLPVFSKK